jgi:hypothetical protein
MYLEQYSWYMYLEILEKVLLNCQEKNEVISEESA